MNSSETQRYSCLTAELNDGAYREVLKRLRPGMKEYEVAGILEGYPRGNGADKTFNLVFSRMSEAVHTMAGVTEENNFKLTTPMGHFCGLNLLEARYDADSQVVLNPGVTAILHPRLDDSKGRSIILWGETYMMPDQWPARLSQTDDTLHSV